MTDPRRHEVRRLPAHRVRFGFQAATLALRPVARNLLLIPA